MPDVETGPASSPPRQPTPDSRAVLEPLLSAGASGDKAAAQPEAPSHAAVKAKKLSNAIVFGVINGIVGIPTMISFATIIYKASPARLYSMICYGTVSPPFDTLQRQMYDALAER